MISGLFFCLLGGLLLATLSSRRLRGKLFNSRRSYVNSKPGHKLRIAMLALLGVVFLAIGSYVLIQSFDDDSHVKTAAGFSVTE